MGSINILNKHITELIAAGEVVENPAAALKELLENSIDSGATKIVVKVRNGGISEISVTDNGSGIEAEDIRLAFLKNATSKIKKEKDLEEISTLGFRGEALASICAVSKVEVITKIRKEPYGVHYRINAGEELLLEEGSCPNGTTIIVKDLFYNTPARMKFLKSSVKEGNAVNKIVTRIALSRVNVGFTLIKDKKEELKTLGDGRLESAIYSIYGKKFLDDLLAISHETGHLKISGYISFPECCAASRSMQIFFVNKRYVKSDIIKLALEQAYKGYSMVGKFPCCVLFLEIPLNFVDVNVHPAKTEVRFGNEKLIYSFVYEAIKNALYSLYTKKIPELKNDFSINKEICSQKAEHKNANSLERLKENDSKKVSAGSVFEEITLDSLEHTAPAKMQNNRAREGYNSSTGKTLEPTQLLSSNSVSKVLPSVKNKNMDNAINQEQKIEQLNREANLNDEELKERSGIKDEEKNNTLKNCSITGTGLIGEIFKTYIILELNDSEFMFVDKHAAHERLIYEKLKSKKISKVDSQVLLTPVALTLSEDECTTVLDNKDAFLNFGFEIEDFGPYTVLVRSAPVYIDETDIKPTLLELVGHFVENKNGINNINNEKLDSIYKSIACRAAIKARDITKREELISLIEQINENNIRCCPHGRPVYVVIKKLELEKKFFRK